MGANDDFLREVVNFTEECEEKMEVIAKAVMFKVLVRLVKRSPVGNPQLWKINETAVNYNAAVKAHNRALKSDASNLTKAGKLRKGLKVHDSMDIKKPGGYTGGRFRGNWQVTMDSAATEPMMDRIDKNGQSTLEFGLVALEEFKVGTTGIFISNMLPYAYPLEYGHSTQAPQGMVRITAREFGSMLRTAIRENT